MKLGELVIHNITQIDVYISLYFFIFHQRRPIIFFVPSRMFSYSLLLLKMFIFIAIKWYRSNSESCEGNEAKDPDIDFE